MIPLLACIGVIAEICGESISFLGSRSRVASNGSISDFSVWHSQVLDLESHSCGSDETSNHCLEHIYRL